MRVSFSLRELLARSLSTSVMSGSLRCGVSAAEAYP
jgi:hypothetical protein